MSELGAPVNRVDGKRKVTGTATYAAEFSVPRIAYAVMVQSTIANGRILSIDASQAERIPGVLAVLTPENAPRLPAPQSRISLLQDKKVHYNGQPIAVAIAEDLQTASHAASVVRVQYQSASAKLDFEAEFPMSRPGSHNNIPGDMSWGDVDGGLAQAEIKIDQIYTTPIQNHNPMEPHATIAEWDGNHLTLHDATQNIFGVRGTAAQLFAIPEEQIHVIAPFIGGAFGCKGQTWSHVLLAAMAAKDVNRPVKLVLDRPQMFSPVGARPRTHQHLTVGATREGKLTAIRHEVHAHTSVLEDYLESSAFPTRVMYACENISTTHRIVPLNLGTPTYMRAPGVATGTYALEVAMDELAYRIKVDPLQLRLLNYTEVDPHTKAPFTEKSLRECYMRGAEKFGWAKRNPNPRSMKRGSQLLGWGMATETYPANSLPASALVRLQPNGRVMVASGTEDIGTGMYTIMTQVAADTLDVPTDVVDAHIGDTLLPQAPLAAGSMSTASVMPAVQAAAMDARQKLINLATEDPMSPLYRSQTEDIEFKNGTVFLKSAPAKSETFASVVARQGDSGIEGRAQIKPHQDEQFSRHSFGAIFAEVTVDADLGMVRVPRIVAVYDVGKVLNAKTARNQFIGGIVWGVSLALFEETYVDDRNGRIVNANLAEYRVPVNADIGEIDVSAIDAPDTKLNPLGARGIGEIGITGTGAAVANAIYHATGKRVRDLPITPEKLI